jgi:hypothetical protein
MLQEQHAQQRLCGRGRPTERRGARTAVAEVGAHGLGQRVVVKQRVQLPQDRVDAPGHLGHTGEEVFLGVAIDQHGPVLLAGLSACARIRPRFPSAIHQDSAPLPPPGFPGVWKWFVLHQKRVLKSVGLLKGSRDERASDER